MKKIILFIILLIPIKITALTYPELHYENAIIYDLTDDKILYEKNSEEQKAMASLTKLMTIITAIENTDDTNKKITYTNEMKSHVAWYASVVGFQVGDKLTFNDLLYGAMLPSGADATVALAITASGSLENFIEKMNNLAKEIGMSNTHFVNVHGLDENNHYSTAKDIKILLKYALQNETFKKVYTTKEYKLSTGKIIKSTVLKQGSKYNLNTKKILGSKTGFTDNAGLCISVLMKDEGHEIILITLGAPSGKDLPYNITDALTLIDFIERNYNQEKIIESNQLIKSIKVKESKISSYNINSTKEISLYLPKDYNKDDIKIEYNGTQIISYKNNINEELGTIKYYYQNKLLDSEKIYLKENIKIDYIKILKNNKSKIIIIFCILIILIIIILLIKRTRKITS